MVLRVVFPNGDREHFSVNDTAAAAALPDGFNVVSLDITEIDEATRNISLTLSITNASFLEGGQITCDDTTVINKVEARCPVASMLIYLMHPFQIVLCVWRYISLCDVPSFAIHHLIWRLEYCQ